MNDNLFPFVARLYDNQENIIGSGFLASSERLVTAKHVILGSLDTLNHSEDGKVLVEFDLPLISPNRKHWAVTSIEPDYAKHNNRFEQSDFTDDFAVLETTGSFPSSVYKTVFLPASNLVGNRFWTYGFLDNYSDGMAITGEMLGPGPPGILQLQGDNPVSYFVQKGFSGSPVWNIEIGAVVAMIVAAEEGGKHFAVAITLETILKENPILAKDSLDSLRSTYKKNSCQITHTPKFEVASPLDDVWYEFDSYLPWHARIAIPLKRIRHFANNFNDLNFLCKNIDRLSFTSSYEKLRADIIRFLDDSDENNVFSKIRAHKKRLEKETGYKAPQVRAFVKELEKTARREGSHARYSMRELDPDEIALYQIDAIRKNIFDLRKLIGRPEFQRCFFITGTLGSGKTHFLNRIQSWVGEELGRDGERFVLCFDPPDEKLNFNDLFLTSMYRQMELKFSSLDSMHQHFVRLSRAFETLREQAGQENRFQTTRHEDIFDDERFGYYDSDDYEDDSASAEEYDDGDFFVPELQSAPPPAHVQIILAIDDISRWSLRYPHMISSWIKTIKEWTVYQEIFWIGSMPLHFYPDLIRYSGRDRDFWLIYGPLKELKAPNIGGWIALDNLNVWEEVGLLLIRNSSFNDETNQEVEWLIKEIDNHEHLKRILCNPFNAWALIETLPEMQVHSVIDLNFIDFIHKFRSQQFSSLLANDVNLFSAEPLKEIHLHQFVDSVAGYLARSGEISPQKGFLLKDVVKEADKTGSDLSDKKRAEFALSLLCMSNILSIRQIEKIHSVPVECVEFPFEAFWHYLFACRFFSDYPQIPDSVWVLENRLARFRKSQLPGILEFYMLLVSQQDPSTQNVAIFFEQVLESRSLPKSAAWYAAAKASPTVQAALLPKLENIIQQTTDRESLYALMYFLGELSYSQLNISKFVRLLQSLYSEINDAGLEQFFVFLIGQALESVQNANEIIEAMPFFSGCEVFDIKDEITDGETQDREEWDEYPLTEDLARMVVSRLKDLIVLKHQESLEYEENYSEYFLQRRKDGRPDEECYRELIALILKYLTKVRQEHKHKSTLPQKKKMWKRQLFREWVMHHFLGDFVDDIKSDAYFILSELDWYEHPTLSKNKLLTRQMEQEANIALGRLMWTGGRIDLINLVRKLSESDDPMDRCNAFHIIRHTVPTSGATLRASIDKDLHPVLEDLYMDPALDGIVAVSIFEPVFMQLENYYALSKSRTRQASQSKSSKKKRRKYRR